MHYGKKHDPAEVYSLFAVFMAFFLSLVLAIVCSFFLADSIPVLKDEWPEEYKETIHWKIPETYVYEAPKDIFRTHYYFAIFPVGDDEPEKSVRFDVVDRYYVIPEYIIKGTPNELSDRLNSMFRKPFKMDSVKRRVIRLEVDGEIIIDPEYTVPIYKDQARKDMIRGCSCLAGAIFCFVLGIYAFKKWKEYNG